MRDEENRSRPFAKKLRAKMPKAEVLLWMRFKEANKRGYNFRRQHPIGPYIADFACALAKLAIELDGATHSSDSEIRRDAKRDAYMKTRGWRVLRITNADLYADLDMAVEYVLSHLPPPARDVRRAPPPP
ncbi:MAG TPA: endonuclease domain-containing protein [Rhizomicrobium sp.]|nr:endonuclease domain-containing protein [Rhizomicrobium sp.]